VEIRQKAPTNKIGGKANGDGVEVTEVDEEAEVRWDRLGVTPEAEEDVDVVTLLTLIHWRAIAAGCVAIWPVTVPRQHSRREVSMIDLPEEHFPNPGSKAQGIEEEVVGSASGVSMCCMMKMGIHIPWMMQVNCTSPSNAHWMLAMLELRRKNQKK